MSDKLREIGRLIGRLRPFIDETADLQFREGHARIEPTKSIEIFRNIAAEEHLPRKRHACWIDLSIRPDRGGAVSGQRVVKFWLTFERIKLLNLVLVVREFAVTG